MTKTRIADHPVEDLFLNRWSPRAYDGSSMPKEDLMSVLEAARWAPSCYNIQPWRFVYALREDDENWHSFHAILDEFNQAWAGDASALVFLVSDSLMPGDGDRPDRPSRYNSLDAGAAWAQMALQATLLGYQAHAMAGMDFEKAREILNVPERFRIEIAIAWDNRDPRKNCRT